MSENIKKVVQNYKICQKFAKLVNRPKVTLPKLIIFNEVFTLDLKTFGSKDVLRTIDSFSKFLQGKVLQNKRDKTIVKAVTDTWILCFEILSVGFYVDNGGEFVNIKMHKRIA